MRAELLDANMNTLLQNGHETNDIFIQHEYAMMMANAGNEEDIFNRAEVEQIVRDEIEAEEGSRIEKMKNAEYMKRSCLSLGMKTFNDFVIFILMFYGYDLNDSIPLLMTTDRTIHRLSPYQEGRAFKSFEEAHGQISFNMTVMKNILDAAEGHRLHLASEEADKVALCGTATISQELTFNTAELEDL